MWPNVEWAESISERSVCLDSSELGSDVSERPVSAENKEVIPTVGHRSSISASAEAKLSLISEADGAAVWN